MTQHTEQLHFRVDARTKEKLTKLARENGLCLTVYIRHILTLEANKCTD